jgi:hypothetical protein
VNGKARLLHTLHLQYEEEFSESECLKDILLSRTYGSLLELLACESIPSLVLKIRHQLNAARVVGAKIAGVRALTEKAPGVNGAREGGRGKRVKTRASLVVERKEEIVEVTKEVAKEGAYGNRGRKTNGADFFFLSFFLFYAGGCTIPFSLFFLPLTLH